MVDTYAGGPFGMDEPTERDRLLLLQRYRDEDTFQVLRSLPMTGTWRCLEIGAGTGSVAYWLGEQCPNGRIVALDTDTRNLDPDRLPNVEVLAADITTHEFATAAFDLIHARAVLCHLPQREEVVAKTFQWLAPGGWLVIEDVYTLPVGSSPYPAMNRYAEAARQSAQRRGADMQWGSTLPAVMAKHSFTDIGAQATPRLVGLGGIPDDLWRLNLTQAGPHLIHGGLLTRDDLDECLTLLDDPAFADIRYFAITGWGRKPTYSAPSPNSSTP